MLAFAIAAALAASPPDPFADEYVPGRPIEVGVGAGQLRPVALGGVAGGFQPTVRGTLEFTPMAYFGLRASAEASFELASARAGIGVHFLPYRRVDLGLWFESGPAVIDFTSAPKVAPLLVGGVSFELALGPLLFFRIEAQLGWGEFPGDRHHFKPGLLAGFGLAL